MRCEEMWRNFNWRVAGQIVRRGIVIAVSAVLIVGAVAIFVVPRLVGGASLTVLSGSMEPALAPGDVIVVRGVDTATVCADVAINDIITYFPEPGRPDLITHRVIAKTVGTFSDGTKCRFVVQGDANSAVDRPVSPEQVRGHFMYGIPKLGFARDWVGRNPQLVVAGIIALAVAAYAVDTLGKPKGRYVTIPTPNGIADLDPQSFAPTNFNAVAGTHPGIAGPAPQTLRSTTFNAAPNKSVIAGSDPQSLPQPALVIPARGAFGDTARNLTPTPPNQTVNAGNTQTVIAGPDPQSLPHASVSGTLSPELALRMRELDLRERELRLREHEAHLASGYSPELAGAR